MFPLRQTLPPSPLLKIIRVHPPERDGAHRGDADAMLNHELRQPLAVDEDDLFLSTAGIFERVFVEVAGGDDCTKSSKPADSSE
jgi:hypothetical protein